MDSFPQPVRPAAVGRIEAMKRGFSCRCPACGQGRLFRGFLKVVDSCEACGVEMHHHRADDLPPYVVMFIVGHLVGYGILMSETRFEWPLWVHLAVWPALTLALCLLLMQPVKGAVVGLQYALGMHGFGTARARAARTGEIERDGDAGADESPRLGGA
ncbi:DUF983 domain-containing protein [Microvirga thermotolerans]|uniref:DUF983 domain-containing protein n=1 Tax=Microvirga thermotolerans TaxID=2651334 RepID=A0A5P9JZ17_9HYPH|nr:DUF983 domain-containing protein [Microvirga thermotolerans]QFU16660.1 DUF983 domain-containing protein [Microvirga thermotolerans]